MNTDEPFVTVRDLIDHCAAQDQVVMDLKALITELADWIERNSQWQKFTFDLDMIQRAREAVKK